MFSKIFGYLKYTNISDQQFTYYSKYIKHIDKLIYFLQVHKNSCKGKSYNLSKFCKKCKGNFKKNKCECGIQFLEYTIMICDYCIDYHKNKCICECHFHEYYDERLELLQYMKIFCSPFE